MPAIPVSIDDANLVRRARDGDATAFGVLVERHMRRAYYAALSLVGRREDALDLSQEAFARAFRARHSLDPERPFYAWLYQILRRLCFNFLRDRRTRARALQQAGSWLADEAASRFVTDPSEALARSGVHEAAGRIARAGARSHDGARGIAWRECGPERAVLDLVHHEQRGRDSRLRRSGDRRSRRLTHVDVGCGGRRYDLMATIRYIIMDARRP